MTWFYCAGFKQGCALKLQCNRSSEISFRGRARLKKKYYKNFFFFFWIKCINKNMNTSHNVMEESFLLYFNIQQSVTNYQKRNKGWGFLSISHWLDGDRSELQSIGKKYIQFWLKTTKNEMDEWIIIWSIICILKTDKVNFCFMPTESK